MSSSPTVPTSTIALSSSCRSQPEVVAPPKEAHLRAAQLRTAQLRAAKGRSPTPAAEPGPEGSDETLASTTAVIACGALGAQLREIVRRRGFDVAVHCLPPLLHNRPERISGEVEKLARRLRARHERVVVAYADCGTYGALDHLCETLQLSRLPGLHCYDVFAGPDRIRKVFAEEPGTYLLTDFLVRSFRRTVLAELGLDRRPELWADYFGNYRRVVWLAQAPTNELTEEAGAIAAMFGLPLSVITTGSSALEVELERLVHPAEVGLPGPRAGCSPAPSDQG